MKKGEGSSKQRVVYEYDFFDENRTGPARSYLLPMGREATPAEVLFHKDLEVVEKSAVLTASQRRQVRPIRPRFIPTKENEADILFEKTLEAIDTSNTLFVGWSKRVMGLLTEEERGKVEREGFLEVPTEDPSGNGYMMRLKQSSIFIDVAEISGEWFKLISDNKLQEGDWVYGWGYRKDREFCIAIKYYHRLLP
ncbi:hypothetical protein AAHA92_24417 [Salvia divinorum]|uniref:Uncharacterized protein n=1 Tax=Salvia divinorum TaxID=28513 RepID=A0ABD1G7B1_SALDI